MDEPTAEGFPKTVGEYISGMTSVPTSAPLPSDGTGEPPEDIPRRDLNKSAAPADVEAARRRLRERLRDLDGFVSGWESLAAKRRHNNPPEVLSDDVSESDIEATVRTIKDVGATVDAAEPDRGILRRAVDQLTAFIGKMRPIALKTGEHAIGILGNILKNGYSDPLGFIGKLAGLLTAIKGLAAMFGF